MAKADDNARIALRARQLYIDELLRGLPGLVARVGKGARDLLDKPAEYLSSQRRRDLLQGLIKHAGAWQQAVNTGLRHLLAHGVMAVPDTEQPPLLGDPLSLVDNDTIEREILTSRLALAIMDRASWEFTDLRSRLAMLERRAELDTHDMLRAHILARVVLDGWPSALSPRRRSLPVARGGSSSSVRTIARRCTRTKDSPLPAQKSSATMQKVLWVKL